MNTLNGLTLSLILVSLSGFSPCSAWAQQNSSEKRSTEKLPPDVYPDTLSRMPTAKLEDMTTEEDKRVFQSLLDQGYNTPARPTGGTVIRSHLPVIAKAYAENLEWLRKKIGLEPRYFELAVLVTTRETNEEYEWAGHEKNSLPVLPREVVEVVRNKKDTKGLEEKDAVLIQFGREMHRQARVSSKTFADMERLFGRKPTLAITLVMGYYAANALLFRAYDLHLAPSRGVKPFPAP